MAALSALVFSLSWWLGLYLLARDPRKPVLVLAAAGLTSFAVVVALDAVRLVAGSDILGRIEIYLVAVPGILDGQRVEIEFLAHLLQLLGARVLHRDPDEAVGPFEVVADLRHRHVGQHAGR